MRTDLRLNYLGLEYIADRLQEYWQALEDLEDSLDDLKDFLGEQESEAVEQLLDKINEAKRSSSGKIEELKALESSVNGYVDTMRSIASEITSGQETRIDTLDIWANIGTIGGYVNEASIQFSKSLASGFHPSNPFITDEDAKGKQQNEQDKLERNYDRLNEYRANYLAPGATRIGELVQDIRDIYETHLKNFENTDDSLRKELNGLYDKYTSGTDKFWNGVKLTDAILTNFFKAFVVAAAVAAAIAMLPAMVIVVVVVAAAAGAVILAATPEEYVPDCLKGAQEKVQEVLKDPAVLVEDIAQGLTDQVQTPEGIASLAGEAIGTFAGAWAGVKLKANMNAGVVAEAGETGKTIEARKLTEVEKQTYKRPSGYRKGVRETVWENAKGTDGVVRDPLTQKPMNIDEPWDMGHKSGHEFWKHQQSAADRGIPRAEFLNEHNNPYSYRPEIPSSNRGRALEDVTNKYFGK